MPVSANEICQSSFQQRRHRLGIGSTFSLLFSTTSLDWKFAPAGCAAILRRLNSSACRSAPVLNAGLAPVIVNECR